MKCPKCGYVGFAQAERCRNCGFDFALVAAPVPPDLTLRSVDRPSAGVAAVSVDDLVLIDAAAARADDIESRRRAGSAPQDLVGDLPLFTPSPAFDSDTIVRPQAPRPPLSVRRATPTPESVRALVDVRADTVEVDLGMPLQAAVSPAVRASGTAWAPSEAAASRAEIATLETRAVAVAIDLGLLAVIDLVVVYFTLQVCGLPAGEFARLPLGPLAAFLTVQNGGYLVAFTAGGQTIGKMVTGIRVVPASAHGRLDLARALVRTVAWAVLAAPAGLGLLTALLDDNRRGLHDRLAGTKVIRAAR